MLRLIRLPMIAVAACSLVIACSKKETAQTPSANSPSAAEGANAKTPEAADTDEPIRFSLKGAATAEAAGQEVPSVEKAPPMPTPADAKPGLMMPEIAVYFPPFYPLSQRMQGVEGKVDLDLALDTEGRVKKVEVGHSTAPQFNEYAVAAAKAWLFTPARIDGKPIEVNVRFPVHFVSEFASGSLRPNSPLAGLAFLDGRYYTVSEEGKYSPANVRVTPLLRLMPAYRPTEGDTRNLRVVLNFTVTMDGQVRDPEIAESSSTDFDQKALEAVRFWQFVPQITDGQPVERHNVRLPVVYTPEPKAGGPSAALTTGG